MPVTTKEILYMLISEFGLKRVELCDRVKLQKTIYLLQAAGMKLGYGFGWYKYGPYSQDLVYDAYDILQDEQGYRQKTSNYEFNESTEQKIAQFKQAFGSILKDVQMLELVASIRFIKNTWYPESSRSDIFTNLQKHKQKFFDGEDAISKKQTQDAFDFCTQLEKFV